MKSNSTLKLPTTALKAHHAVSNSTKTWLWGFMLLTALLVSGVAVGQTTINITTTGAGTFTVPCDVNSITVEAWGGGGAGGGTTANNSGGGGGGAGGAYVSSTLIVTAGQIINYNIGTGANGVNNNGGSGNPTWFVNNSTLYAQGGAGGQAPNNGRAGGLGSSALSIGDIVNAGNNGANGTVAIGAAGGSSINGGAGGNQRNTGGNGNQGISPGGGGGGAFVNNNTDRAGGNGGNGQIRITYTSLLTTYCSPTFPSGVEPITNVTFAGINNTTSNVVNATPALESFCDIATVVQGTTYGISVRGNTNGDFTDYYRVYVDWDQNGVFGNNPNEIYSLGTITNSTGVDANILTSNIFVPRNAQIGSTRMRVIKRFGNYANGPCQTITPNWGQAEDYNVLVSACTLGGGTGTTDLACPSVLTGGLGLNGADPVPVNCDAAVSVELEANYLELGDTSSYRVESIDYNPPYQLSCLENPIDVTNDDVWSSRINLPFPFCFYGNTYNSYLVGSNGVISFSPTIPGGSATGWRIDNNLPSTVNGADGPFNYFYGPSIYGVHHDIDPRIGGEFSWELITLNTGCRAMVVGWHDVPMYADNNILYSGMMVFYENTNVIEVYIEKKSIDGGAPWNNGRAQVGIQNANGTLATTAPSRNDITTPWTTTQEAWRFVPDGGSITSITWYEGSGTTGPVVGNTSTITVNPSVTTTYTAEVTYNLCNSGGTLIETDETTVTVTGGKVWNGSVNNNWYTPANWTPAIVPTEDDCVIIPNIATTNNRRPIADITAIGPPIPPGTPALAKNLTIQNDGIVEVESNTYLEVVDWVTVEPNGLLDLKDSASLIQITDVLTNNNTGSLDMHRTATLNFANDYIYWSSPVEGFNVGGISPGTNPNFIFEWQPTVAGLYGTWTNATGPMTTGKGYIVRGLSGTTTPSTALFRGRPSNGVIEIPITRGNYNLDDYPGPGNTMATANDDNWNLIGNPYPSALSADEFLLQNAGILTGDAAPIEGTIYLWQHLSPPVSATDPFYGNYVYNYNAGDYLAYNSTGPNPASFSGSIASGQAFFVLMDHAAPTPSNVVFNNTMRDRTQGNNQFFRQNTIERHRIWLDLVNSNNKATSTLVGYIEGATNGIDRLFDGDDLSATNLKLYSIVDDKNMAIQGRSLPFNVEDMVTLGFNVPTNGTYTIAINNLDGLFETTNQNIYLEDMLTNTIHDLKANPYVFTTVSGTHNSRFILRYTNQTLGVNDPELNASLNIVSYNNEIKVTSTNNPISTIEVYDILGRTIATYKDVNVTEFKFNLSNISNGTFIVKATLYNGQQKVKKIVH